MFSPTPRGNILDSTLILFFFNFFKLQGSNRVKDVGDDDFEQDGNGSDLRKAAAFFYIGLVWIFSFVLVAWIVHQKIYQNDHEHHEHEEH